MKPVIVCLVVLVAAAMFGCAETKKPAVSQQSNGVLDITPSPASTYTPAPVALQSLAVEPAPADTITYTRTPSSASDVQLASNTTSIPTSGKYKVKAGDTLYGIARTTYGDGKQWQRIASANPGLSPNSLKAGQTIMLP